MIFNYRLSRARSIVENAFVTLAARLREYQRRVQLSPGHIRNMIQATIELHNYLQKTSVEAAPGDGSACITFAVAHQTKRPMCVTPSRNTLCQAIQ